jgi:hypothetical protein
MSMGMQHWYSDCSQQEFSEILQEWMSTPEIQQYLKVNRFEDQVWYDADAFESFEEILSLMPVFEILNQPGMDHSSLVEALIGSREILSRLHEISLKSEYKLDKLLEVASGEEEGES